MSLGLGGGAPTLAQQGAADKGAAEPGPALQIPVLWPLEQRLQRPDTGRFRQIRFLTESDYPPFNYVDEAGELVGFNVELAAAICAALKVDCSIKTRVWDKLFDELDKGRGDAIIASVAITANNRRRVDFSDRYYLTPARFAARKDGALAGARPTELAGKKVGVVEATAHEAYLRAFFASAEIIAYKSREEARKALKEGAVAALFDDGISLAFWLHGKESQDCCVFIGGPYLESRYFGEGVGIAVKKDNDTLRKLLDYALRQVVITGKYEEIFLKYFPLSFY